MLSVAERKILMSVIPANAAMKFIKIVWMIALVVIKRLVQTKPVTRIYTAVAWGEPLGHPAVLVIGEAASLEGLVVLEEVLVGRVLTPVPVAVPTDVKTNVLHTVHSNVLIRLCIPASKRNVPMGAYIGLKGRIVVTWEGVLDALLEKTILTLLVLSLPLLIMMTKGMVMMAGAVRMMGTETGVGMTVRIVAVLSAKKNVWDLLFIAVGSNPQLSA